MKVKVNDIIKELEIRIEEWKEDRKKIAEDKYKNYLYDKSIDYSIDDIVIVELMDLLRFANGGLSE